MGQGGFCGFGEFDVVGVRRENASRTVGGRFRFRYRMRIPYTPDPFYGVGVSRVVGNGCIFQPEHATQ